MTSQALLLVLTAAFLHAIWNLLAKRAATQSTVSFVWLVSAVSTLIYLPIVLGVLLFFPLPPLGMTATVMMLGTGLIHTAYFFLLQRGYRVGDMSLVYPLARGSGPLLTVVAAIAFFGERPGSFALAGIVCIICGIFVAIGLRIHRVHNAARSVGYGIATGATIAAYTLWDKHAMGVLVLSPLIYDFGRNIVQTALVSPLAVGKGPALRQTWKAARWEIVGIATLSPLAYILVLTALKSAPASLVGPAREVSIVIGAFLGAHYFSEGHTKQRVVAALLMLLGIVAIAIS